MTQPDRSKEDEILDELLKQKNLGGPIFVEKTMTAIREDSRRRQRLRSWLARTGAIAASLALVVTLWRSPVSNTPDYTGATAQNLELEADAALYGEMLALESLLQPADMLAEEENHQTLNLLIALTQY